MRSDHHVILYIDDDQDYLDAMREIVESAGYVMVEAHTAEEGLRVYRRESPDLIIVDLMMEEVDAGTAFVKEMKALGSEAPIYLLSSLGDTLALTTDAGALGLAGVLQKPLDPKTIVTLLDAQLKPASS
jgi:DNA-binding response OmpR family regulator